MEITTVCKFLSDNSGRSYYFFHHKHDVPKPLGDEWTPVSAVLPMHIVPRPGIEDGVIDSVAKYIQVFHRDDIEVTFERPKTCET